MNLKNLHASEEFKLCEYALEDFLEIKASIDRKLTGPLKDALFSSGLKNVDLSLREGFILAKNLVVIEPTDANSIERLIFLNPRNGRICVKPLAG